MITNTLTRSHLFISSKWTEIGLHLYHFLRFHSSVFNQSICVGTHHEAAALETLLGACT